MKLVCMCVVCARLCLFTCVCTKRIPFNSRLKTTRIKLFGGKDLCSVGRFFKVKKKEIIRNLQVGAITVPFGMVAGTTAERKTWAHFLEKSGLSGALLLTSMACRLQLLSV